ncbi:MAG: hypothetical protein DMG35_07230 [Acidobacteria bacterium]|nr:MAG: hypothetical protein DMG35_07230 [Acidobacteriota bacterium]
MIISMKVRSHPKILAWPPSPGGTNVTAEYPQAESQPIVREVHISSVRDKSVPLSGEFKANLFTYDVLTKDQAFAKRLAVEFSKHIGETLQQFGNLDIDF